MYKRQLYGIDDGTVQKALTTFHGADRRFEYKGEKNGFTIIDDYAHHPTEIRATLTAAKNYPHKTLWCAFQPHTYTRTRAFLKDFASALSLADKVTDDFTKVNVNTFLVNKEENA